MQAMQKYEQSEISLEYLHGCFESKRASLARILKARKAARVVAFMAVAKEKYGETPAEVMQKVRRYCGNGRFRSLWPDTKRLRFTYKWPLHDGLFRSKYAAARSGNSSYLLGVRRRPGKGLSKACHNHSGKH